MELIENLFLPIAIVENDKFVMCNDVFSDFLGFTNEQVIGINVKDLLISADEDEHFDSQHDHCKLLQFLRNVGQDASDCIADIKVFNSNYYAIPAKVHCKKESDSQRLLLSFKFDSDKSLDAITGLRNGWALSSLAGHYLSCLDNAKDNIALIVLSIDNFSTINFRYGFYIGDLYLKAFGQHLKHNVDLGQLVVRLSSGRFGILLVNHEQLCSTDFNMKVEALRQKLCDLSAVALNLGDDILIHKSLSIGISALGHHYGDYFSMELAAEAAMHEEKKLSHSQYCVASDNGNKELLAHKLIIDELPEALANNDIIMHYQPQYCLQTNTLVGFEALSRWHHSELGPVRPDIFVAIAEEIGLHFEFDLAVFEQVCKQVVAWNNAGLENYIPRIAINVSFKTLEMTTFAARVEKIIQQLACPADKIEIEVTETTSVNNIDMLASNITQIKALGVHIAIDDFGSGYSSLSLIRRLRGLLDKLKIDRSLVANISEATIDKEFARKIIGLCRTLGIKALAEGVETQEQRDILTELSCDYAQGYLYDPALTHDQAAALMKVSQRCKLKE